MIRDGSGRRRFPGRRTLRAAGWAGALVAFGLAVANFATPSQVTAPASSPMPSVGYPSAASSPMPPARLRVVDGDTLEVRATGERIRLANIDTPETGERAQCRAERAAGDAATRAARQIIAAARRVTITRTARQDVYGRTVGYVSVDGRDLGLAMIAAGHARPWRGRREAWCGRDGRLLR